MILVASGETLKFGFCQIIPLLVPHTVGSWSGNNLSVFRGAIFTVSVIFPLQDPRGPALHQQSSAAVHGQVGHTSCQDILPPQGRPAHRSVGFTEFLFGVLSSRHIRTLSLSFFPLTLSYCPHFLKVCQKLLTSLCL